MFSEIIQSYFYAALLWVIISSLRADNLFQLINRNYFKKAIEADLLFFQDDNDVRKSVPGDMLISMLCIAPFVFPHLIILILFLYYFRFNIASFLNSSYEYIQDHWIRFNNIHVCILGISGALLILTTPLLKYLNIVFGVQLLVVLLISTISTFFKEQFCRYHGIYVLLNRTCADRINLAWKFISASFIVFVLLVYLLFVAKVTKITEPELHLQYAFLIISLMVSYINLSAAILEKVISDIWD